MQDTINRLLEMLSSIPRLQGSPNVFYCPDYLPVDADPSSWQYKFMQELARITGHVSIDLRYWDQAKTMNAVNRCIAHDGSLCLHISPLIPSDNNYTQEIGQMEDRLSLVDGWLPNSYSIKVARVFIDLEGGDFRFGTDLELNDAVAGYNKSVYELCKGFSKSINIEGVGVPVGRVGHLSINSLWPNQAKRSTRPFGYSDGGFNLGWFNLADEDRCLEELARTIEYAELHGIAAGTVWPCLGAIKYPSLCPGIGWGNMIGSSGISAYPHHPRRSFLAGRFISYPSFAKNRRYPDFSLVHSLVVWPGPLHAALDATGLVQWVAFLLGAANAVGYPEELDMHQAEMWNQAYRCPGVWKACV